MLECARGQIAWRRAEANEVFTPVLDLDYRELCGCDDMTVNTCEWEAPALDARLQPPAKALHGKSPVCPDWPRCLDTICDVQESMNCEWAGREEIGQILIVEPRLC